MRTSSWLFVALAVIALTVVAEPDHVYAKVEHPLATFERVLNARWSKQAQSPNTAFVGAGEEKDASSSNNDDDDNQMCLRVAGAFALEIEGNQVPQLAQTAQARRVCNWFKKQQQGQQQDAKHQDDGDDGVSPLDLTTKPQQIHISVTNIEGNVTVLWTTSWESTHSAVCWWPEEGTSSSSVPPASKRCVDGTYWTYNPVSVIPWIGSLHGAFMTDLTPKQRYCYQVMDPVLNVSSHVVCFTCPKLYQRSTEDESLLVALGGDMGSYQLLGHLVATQMRKDELAQNLKFDAFWLLGDIAYSTLDPPHWNFEFFWDIFLQQEESFADHVPLLVTYGNHDFAGGDSGAFLNRFRNPTTGNSNSSYYWAYDHGPVRFVSMCTEVGLNPVLCDYKPGSTQYLWLEEQFKTVNRTKTPWLVLAGHRPMYSSDKAKDSGPLQRYIEPLLLKYKVDIEMSGHMHETELCAPAADNVPKFHGVSKINSTSYPLWRFDTPQAPVHMTVGTLGALISEHWDDPQPEWSLFRQGQLFSDSYGYAQARINREWFNVSVVLQKDNSTVWAVEIRRGAGDRN